MGKLQQIEKAFAGALAICALVGGLAAHAQSAAQRQSVTPSTTVVTPAAPKMPDVGGTTIDRVIAIVNGDLILDSDVNEEQRFDAIQPFRTSGAGGSDSSYDRAIERLIDRDLILQQSKLQPEDAVSDADVAKEFTAMRRNLPECREFHCDTDEGWNRFLASHGFTPGQMQIRWKQRMEVLAFIEERFRMGIRITGTDIKNYYEKTFVPEYEERGGGSPPKLETVSDRIQEVLLQQQVSTLLNDWLRSLRAQGGVIVMHPGQEAP